MAGTHTACNIVLLGYDVLVDGINGLQVVLVACQGCYVSHTGIHIACTDGMSPGLLLLCDGFVTL